jgi:nucleoside-diphosphate-sugar epimerase
MTQTVLILGGRGKIGSHAAEAFAAAGWRVRQYDRKTNDMTKAAIGADVIVNGLNPPMYHDWARTIPAITAQVIAAAQASGATVILPGNLYNYGDTPGALSDQTPHRANSRKGRIRVEMEAAYRRAGVPTIVLRAGNFIDPNGNGDIMSMLLMREIKRGKITAAADPATRQAYAYVPDWARAAVALAERRDSLDRFADVPFPGHCFTVNALAAHVAQVTGRKVKITRFPWWLMTALSPVLEIAREMREMRYLHEMDHWIDGARFHALHPDFVPTPLAQVMEAGLPAEIHPDKVMGASGKAILAQ